MLKKVIIYVLISLGILVVISLIMSFDFSKVSEPNYDVDYLNPTNEQTIVVTSDGLNQRNVAYDQLFTSENIDAVSNIKGVSGVYPTALRYSNPMIEGVRSQYAYLNDTYQVSEALGPDANYDYRIDLLPLDPTPYLTDEEYQKADANNAVWEVYEDSYGSLVSPIYPLQVMANTDLAKYYKLQLLTGDYPADNSNQLLISDKMAYTLCEQDENCQQVDDLVGTEMDFLLTGSFKAATIPDVTLTGEVSGIYFGSRGHNNLITSYDPEQSNTDSFTADVKVAENDEVWITSAEELNENQPIESGELYTEMVITIDPDVDFNQVVNQVEQLVPDAIIKQYQPE